MALLVYKWRRWLPPILLGFCGLLLISSVLLARFLRAPPPKVEIETAAGVRPKCTALYYAESLRASAEKHGVPAVSVEEMHKPLAGGVEFQGAHKLTAATKVLTTERLRLTRQTGRLQNTDGSQGFAADHLILAITNRTSKPLAYRVLTQVSNADKCGSKAEIPHNALVLRPGETVRRSECLLHDKQTLVVIQVESYVISELSALYLERASTDTARAFDERVASAHNRGGQASCPGVPWQPYDRDVDAFRAVVDFYSRHDCEEYTAPPDLKPFSSQVTLPQCLERKQ